MVKLLPVFVLLAANILGSFAFWSLDTDLQLGYEVYDKSYEINAVIQAIVAAATRSNLIQTDDKTRVAVAGVSAIASQLRGSPVSFFNELANAASSRGNNEAWHINRIRSTHANYAIALNNLQNSTGPLSTLGGVANPSVLSTLRASLARVQLDSVKLLQATEALTIDVSRIRANSSLLLTPELIDDFISASTSELLTSSLTGIRNNLALFLSAVRDVERLIAAHGSVHELLSRSFSRDTATRNTALNNFVNNYNRVRNNLLSSVASFRQAAAVGIANFITRVQTTYDDSIVRPRFDQLQLPLIDSFGEVISSRVYNQTFFQLSFDDMRDSILETYSNSTDSLFVEDSQYRERILELQRTEFVRRYSHCLNELVAEAQTSSNSVTSKYAFCLNERTSGIVVVIPSASTWLSVIRDNINFILQQLNGCLSGQTSVAGRTTISDCIQFNVNNLAFYSAYLPVTVESNLRPVVQSPPFIFQNCLGLIPTRSVSRFNDVYSRCMAEVHGTTTEEPASTTTVAATLPETTAEVTTSEPTTPSAATETTTQEITTTPETTTQEVSTPERTTPDATTLEATTAESTTLDASTQAETTPDATTSENSSPPDTTEAPEADTTEPAIDETSVDPTTEDAQETNAPDDGSDVEFFRFF